MSIFMCIVLACAAMDPPPAPPQEIPEEYRLRALAGPPPVLWLVTPMDAAEAEEHFERLLLSESQLHAARQLFEAYRADLAEVERTDIAALTEQGKEVARQRERQGDGYTSEYARLVRRHVRDHHRLDSRISALDDMFFAELGMILADEQLESLPAVEAVRQRSRYPRGNRTWLGVASLDLTALVDAIEMPSTVRREVQPLLDEYGFIVGPLLKARYREVINTSANLAEFRVQYPHPWDESVLAQRTRLLSPQMRVLERLHAATWTYYDRIHRQLPRELADQLQERFDAAVHPTHYPDPDAQHLKTQLARVLASDDLQADQRALIEALHDRYRTEYDKVRRRLDEIITEWDMKLLATSMINLLEKADHEAEVESLLDNRRELSVRLLTDIAGILTPEQAEAADFTQELPGKGSRRSATATPPPSRPSAP